MDGNEVKLSAAAEVQRLFAQAMALHQAGRLNEAATTYGAIRAIDPYQPDTLHMLGMIALQTGSPQTAIELIGQAIARNPGLALAHGNLGAALLALGRHSDAMVALGRALAIQPDFPDALNNRSSALMGLGRLERALADLDRTLALQPAHRGALINKGAVLDRLERFAAAAEHYEMATQMCPEDADLALGYGVALQKSGRPADALKQYRRATELCPNYAEGYYNCGILLQELGRAEEALAIYDRAIAIKSDYADACLNRGNILQQLGRAEEALASYDRAIAIKPRYATAHNNRGNMLQDLGQVEAALFSYDRAIAIKSDYGEAYVNRGIALQKLQRSEDALADYDRAIAIESGNAKAYINHGNALLELMRAEEALSSYDTAIEIRPDFAEAYIGRGNALLELKCEEEALASYGAAIAIKPDAATAYSNRGVALQKLLRMRDAIDSYDKAIAINPNFAEAYCNKALGLLLLGDLGKGWELNEWRWKNKKTSNKSRDFLQPLWLGAENIAGKVVLLHAEQGLGDTIQFCRYAKLVKALGAAVLLEAPKRLLGLLGGLEGVDELIEQGGMLPAFDYHCPLLSLPLAFKTDLATIPSPEPYLAASLQKCDEWAQRLGAKNKPRIGLVWSGAAANKSDHSRSLALQQILPYLPECCDYVSLQKEVRVADRGALEGSNVRHYGDEQEDFTDAAALCSLMDLVISVDTSVGHLAGAIGKSTWMLLPYSPDWRWLTHRSDSPWYESVKLYRQDEERNWSSVLRTIKKELEDFAEVIKRL